MANPQNKPNPKHSRPTIAGKDNRTQAEKDKQEAAMKKDASNKSDKKSGDCR